ncbi:MAG: VanW family protein, partial [Clostridiales bacterium]|nr:VanW family protein [Clostridiales bacterium]
GMTEKEARAAVDDYAAGVMDATFTLTGETGSIELSAEDMGVTVDAEAAVESAINVGHAGNLISRYKEMQDLENEPLVLDMQLSVDKQGTAQILYDNAGDLGIEAIDNSLVRENGQFTFVAGQEGIEVNIVDSVYAINDYLQNGWDGEDGEIELVMEVVEPRGSEEELAQVTDLLGSFSTDFSSSSSGRWKNVENGVSKVNGTIVYPGEELSFHDTVAPFTEENGYELAGSYENGTTVESFGGGICQVSTTLYNALIRSELQITKRYNHSMQISYVSPSMDAAIAGDYKDLCFINNYDTPIYIEGYCSGGIIYFNVYGKETRPSNRTISFESEVLSTDDMEIQFTLDSAYDAGSWVTIQSAHIGCTAQLWKVVTVDGVEESREVFNHSTYQSSPKIIRIGTAGMSEEQLATLQEAIDTGDEATVKSVVEAIAAEIGDEDETDENENPDDGNKTSGGDKNNNKTNPSTSKKDNSSTGNTDNTGGSTGGTGETGSTGDDKNSDTSAGEENTDDGTGNTSDGDTGDSSGDGTDDDGYEVTEPSLPYGTITTENGDMSEAEDGV